MQDGRYGRCWFGQQPPHVWHGHGNDATEPMESDDVVTLWHADSKHGNSRRGRPSCENPNEQAIQYCAKASVAPIFDAGLPDSLMANSSTAAAPGNLDTDEKTAGKASKTPSGEVAPQSIVE